jgi:hypothetical protein
MEPSVIEPSEVSPSKICAGNGKILWQERDLEWEQELEWNGYLNWDYGIGNGKAMVSMVVHLQGRLESAGQKASNARFEDISVFFSSVSEVFGRQRAFQRSGLQCASSCTCSLPAGSTNRMTKKIEKGSDRPIVDVRLRIEGGDGTP